MTYRALTFSGLVLAGGLAALTFAGDKTESKQPVSIEGRIEKMERVKDCYLVNLVQTEVKFSRNYTDYSESPQLKLCGPMYDNFEATARSSKRIKIGAIESCDVQGKGLDAVYDNCHIIETLAAEPLN